METCPNVGFELWQTRKARGLSRAELSSLTKLRIGQIEAFESNDLQALPPTFFVRRRDDGSLRGSFASDDTHLALPTMFNRVM